MGFAKARLRVAKNHVFNGDRPFIYAHFLCNVVRPCIGVRVTWAGRTLDAETADFGAKEPGPKLGDAQIVLAEPLDGSTKLTNAAADGNVVLVKRGNIPFVEKAMNAQNAGATAVIIYNNEDGPPQGMSDNGDYETAAAITIPVVSITQADGTHLAAAIKAGRTTISLQGTFFLQVVAYYLLHLFQQSTRRELYFKCK